MSDIIRTLERVGTPPTVIGALQTLDGSLTHIRAEGYRTDKEKEHIGKAQQVAVDQLQKYLEQDEQAADAERDKELKALETELVERASIPRKRVDELDSEYNGRLLRRQIEETRRLTALMLADVYVKAIGMATDPAPVVAAVDEELAARAAPEAISRIGRAAEAKLQAMAADESRNGEPGPAFHAYTLVGEKLRTWRAGIARESVEARRDQILSRHSLRTMQTRNAVVAAARLFHIDGLLTRAATKAALQSER